MKLNVPLILDTLFTGFCAFLLFFTSVRFYTKEPIIGLIFGICAGVLFAALAYLYISGRQEKKLLLSRDEREKKLLSLHLSLSSDEYVKETLKKYLSGARICGKRVISEGISYFYNFKMHPISEDDIAEIIRKKCEGKKAIMCVCASEEALSLANDFDIKIISIDEIYPALKEKKLLPEKYVYGEKPRENIFKRMRSRFSRKLCAPLFRSGLSLMILSYFTFFPIYYIISGSILLILSAVALVFN